MTLTHLKIIKFVKSNHKDVYDLIINIVVYYRFKNVGIKHINV